VKLIRGAGPPKKRDRIMCSCCDGSGMVKLPPELQITLDLLREHGPLTAPGVFQYLATDDHKTATWSNNRLETLRKNGLVSRRKVNAKTWIYSAVKLPKEAR
jgi:hypothetical protein